MTGRASTLLAVLVLALGGPAVAGAHVYRLYRSSTCYGEMETRLDEQWDTSGEGWWYADNARPRLSPGKALDLATGALRRSGMLGEHFWQVKITLTLLARRAETGAVPIGGVIWVNSLPTFFYLVTFDSADCPGGREGGYQALVVVTLQGAVFLPRAVQARAIAPAELAAPPRRPRAGGSGPGRAWMAGATRLATGARILYQNLACSLFGCPVNDLVLLAPPCERARKLPGLEARSLSARELWYPVAGEWPRLSAGAAVAWAAQAMRQSDPLGPEPGSEGPEVALVRARPGGWLYVVRLSGGPCRRPDSPFPYLPYPLWGEIAVLMNGDALVPQWEKIVRFPHRSAATPPLPLRIRLP